MHQAETATERLCLLLLQDCRTELQAMRDPYLAGKAELIKVQTAYVLVSGQREVAACSTENRQRIADNMDVVCRTGR